MHEDGAASPRVPATSGPTPEEKASRFGLDLLALAVALVLSVTTMSSRTTMTGAISLAVGATVLVWVLATLVLRSRPAAAASAVVFAALPLAAPVTAPLPDGLGTAWLLVSLVCMTAACALASWAPPTGPRLSGTTHVLTALLATGTALAVVSVTTSPVLLLMLPLVGWLGGQAVVSRSDDPALRAFQVCAAGAAFAATYLLVTSSAVTQTADDALGSTLPSVPTLSAVLLVVAGVAGLVAAALRSRHPQQATRARRLRPYAATLLVLGVAVVIPGASLPSIAMVTANPVFAVVLPGVVVLLWPARRHRGADHRRTDGQDVAGDTVVDAEVARSLLAARRAGDNPRVPPRIDTLPASERQGGGHAGRSDHHRGDTVDVREVERLDDRPAERRGAPGRPPGG